MVSTVMYNVVHIPKEVGFSNYKAISKTETCDFPHQNWHVGSRSWIEFTLVRDKVTWITMCKKKAQPKIQKLHWYTDFVVQKKARPNPSQVFFSHITKGKRFPLWLPSYHNETYVSTASGNCDGPLGASFGLTEVLRGVFDMTYATCDGYLQE